MKFQDRPGAQLKAMRASVLIIPALRLMQAAAQTPATGAAEHEAAIARIREAALDYTARLQNFTCVQTTARNVGPFHRRTRWKPLETQELELNYIDHREHYKLLKSMPASNGTRRNPVRREMSVLSAIESRNRAARL